MVSQNPREYDATPDERVALLLAAAAAPAEAGPQPGEAQVLAAFRASTHRTRRFSMFSTPSRTKVAVASTIGAGCFLFAGVGAAAAGVLPGAAQDTAHTWLGTLGIEVPGPDAHSAGHADVRGTSAEADEPADETETETESTDSDATETDTADSDTAESDATGTEAESKGSEVSGLATTTTAEGVDKGAEISTFASGGKSRAGADHPTKDDAAGTADTGRAPVEHPNDGGTGTAGDATAESGDGASAAGTGTADEASSGHSASGSQNRP